MPQSTPDLTAAEKKNLRKQNFIEPTIQSAILKRLTSYWLATVLFIMLPIAFLKVVGDPTVYFHVHLADLFIMHWPVMLMLLALLPFAMNDSVKFSNRFVGPIHRLRNELNRVANGERPQKIRFRNKDFWHDVASAYNSMIDHVDTESEEHSDTPAHIVDATATHR